ncbi:glycosyltransferase [Ligilactobacillus equi]|uniref:glycosyltransferase n=1 Tax=Ligilactobacillus equi TaxID=137357 RepID=UPI002ED1A767
MNYKICAGIVLYNPEIELLKKNVEVLYKQVEEILLYDNGSDNILKVIEAFSNYENITIKNGIKNKGIAHALNEILEWADSKNYEWVLTMDQDSICSKSIIKEYSEYLNSDKVALICPFVLNNGKVTFEEYKKMNLPKSSEITDPVKCITSACLTNVKITKKLKGFNDSLFIDCVDIDLNCKVLEAGYRIIQVNTTYMIQQMGKGIEIPLFDKLQRITGADIFKRAKVVATYSNMRLYYHSRNSRYIRKTYKQHGRQTSALFIFAYYTYFSIFYPHDRSRIKMWKAMIAGFMDYKIIKKG